MNVVELLDQAARANPQTAAFIEGRAGRERVVSYGAFETESRRLATLFAQTGLNAGDGVAVMLPMSAQLYAVIIAAWRVGLVPVFIEPRAGEAHFAACIDRYPLRAFVGSVSACLLRLASPALRQIRCVFVAAQFFPGARSLRAAHHLPPLADNFAASPDTHAMLAFTSGSTGRPKGMVRTHGLLHAMHRVLTTHLKPLPGEVVLATMPIFTLSYLASGATSLIPDVDLRHPGLIDPHRLAEQIAQWSVESAIASPALLERLADHCIVQDLPLVTLKSVVAGGAPVFPRLLDKLSRIASQAELSVLYGSTEAEPIAMMSQRMVSSADLKQMAQGQGLLVGQPIPEIEVRILRDQWGSALNVECSAALEKLTLAPGHSGEIVVRGAHVAPGYLDPADDHLIKFRVGNAVWHRTGDAGWRDEQGRLWLVGRCSARINDARGTLYPYRVEAALSFQPAIVRSAMLLHAGERLLVLEMVRGVRPDIESLLAQLSWACIDAVVLVKQLPVDARHNAKVDYRRLRNLLEQRRWQHRIENHRSQAEGRV